MTADIAKRVKLARDIGQNQTFPINGDPFHLARRQFGHFGDGNEPIGHIIHRQLGPLPTL